MLLEAGEEEITHKGKKEKRKEEGEAIILNVKPVMRAHNVAGVLL